MYKIPADSSRFLWHFIKFQPLGFGLLLIVSLASAVSTTIWPFIISNMVDTLDQHQGDKTALFAEHGQIFLIALVFWFGVELMMRAKGVIMAFVLPRFEANIRMATYRYVSQHSHSYFVTNYVGAIANRIADLPRALSMVVDIAVGQFVSLGVAIIIAVYLLSDIHTLLATIMLVWMVTHLGICWSFFRTAANYSRIQSEARSRVQGRIVDSISNHLSVRIFGRHHYEEGYLSETQEDERLKYKQALIYIEKIKIMLGILSVLGVVSLFYMVLDLWQSSEISLGNVVFVANLTLNMMAMIWVASDEMTYFFREVGLCNQGLKIIQDPVTIQEKEDAKELIVTKGQVEFDNVTFRYRRNGDLFRNKSIILEGGKKVGLVGFSGSGKTTFASLILRLYDVDDGRVLIDGQDVRDVTTESLRNNICLIPQDPILFHRSVMDNIRYGKVDATDEEIVDACKKAHCHEFIIDLENGYQTLVGEHGASLSGGQRQRIAIARAILANTPIIILDEATSALDSITERYIQDSLSYLMQQKTAVIIAHRLSTLLNVDRILVFDKGHIVEEGTHTELLAKEGHYALLWSMQHDGMLPDQSESQRDAELATTE